MLFHIDIIYYWLTSAPRFLTVSGLESEEEGPREGDHGVQTSKMVKSKRLLVFPREDPRAQRVT